MKRFRILVIDRMRLVRLWKKPMPLTGSRSSYHKSRMNTRRQRNISRVFMMSKMLDNGRSLSLLALFFPNIPLACLLVRYLSISRLSSHQIQSTQPTPPPFFLSLPQTVAEAHLASPFFFFPNPPPTTLFNGISM